MKNLAVTVFLLFCSVANAQIRTTVISSKAVAKVATPGVLHESSQSGLRHDAPAGQAPSFSMTFLPDSAAFAPDGGDHPFTGNFTNLTDQVLTVSFHRFQQLPQGWTTSICFGGNCLSDIVDTPSAAYHAKPFEFQPHETEQFILHMTDTEGSPLLSTTVYVRLTALTGNPADTMMLKMIGTADPSLGVADLNLNLTKGSLALYPNPVTSGQEVSAHITLDKPSMSDVTLYDVAGRQVMALPSQRLNAGENSIHLGQLALPSGAYTLRLKTASGEQFSKPFQIIR